MKLFTTGLSLIAALFAFPTNAAPITHTVNLGAVVQGSCSISGSANVTSGAFSNVSQSSSTFTVDVSGSNASPTNGELAIGVITCNSSSMKVSVTPNGWIKTSGGTGEITYSVYLKNGSTTLNSGNPVISSAMGTGTKNVTVSSSTLNLGLVINTNAATNLPAGNYTGTLTLSIDAI
jgi:hypothetical protein